MFVLSLSSFFLLSFSLSLSRKSWPNRRSEALPPAASLELFVFKLKEDQKKKPNEKLWNWSTGPTTRATEKETEGGEGEIREDNLQVWLCNATMRD